MRNHYEHIDERLDKWWAESGTRNHADHVVGPPTTIAGLQPIELFRRYDPSTATANFWGDSYNLRTITDEVNRIFPLLQVEAAKPHWQE